LISPFQVDFAGAGVAVAVRISETSAIRPGLIAVGLHPPRPTVVVVGGAAGLDPATRESLRPLFISGMVPVLERLGGVGVDGGTRAGVMSLFGEARTQVDASFPLVGVVAAGTVHFPETPGPEHGKAELECNHTHFVVVPGADWGAESPWIAQTATILADSASSVTVLLNGGEIAYADVARSVEAGRVVIVVAGTGRTADVIASALSGERVDERASVLAQSGLVHSVRADDPATLASLLESVLGETTTN